MSRTNSVIGPKADPRDVRPGAKFVNRLANGAGIEVRVVEFIESVNMWRVTDARETHDDKTLIEFDRTWACPIDNLEYVVGEDFACGPKEFVEQFHADRRAEHDAREAAALAQCDHSPTPASMYVMGMCSDVQQLIEMGNLPMANAVLNDIKAILQHRIATKDEHGRHDYAPGELNRKTQAKLEYLAKRRNG